MERSRTGTARGIPGLFLRSSFIKFYNICNHFSQRFTPQFLLMRLRHATTAQDDKSEALASTFVQSSSTSPSPGNGEVDDFVKEFKTLRKVYHKRVMWGDRWTAGQVAWRDD